MKTVTMNDLIDQWNRLCKTNTGRCVNEEHRGEADNKHLPYEDCLMTFFLSEGKNKVSFQEVLNKKIHEIKSGEYGMVGNYEDAILEVAARAACAAISYVEFQSGVELRLGRH